MKDYKNVCRFQKPGNSIHLPMYLHTIFFLSMIIKHAPEPSLPSESTQILAVCNSLGYTLCFITLAHSPAIFSTFSSDGINLRPYERTLRFHLHFLFW